MKVGDYVRTHDGRIDKIVDIKNDFIYIENSDYGYRENYLKSSPKIIDLIEVGDYVNGSKVTEIKEGKPYHEDFNDPYFSFYFEDIKSVVTKEMFTNAEYRVETN